MRDRPCADRVLAQSARVLATVLEDREEDLQEANLLELGSGTGYCALVACALGAPNVVATEQASFRLPGTSPMSALSTALSAHLHTTGTCSAGTCSTQLACI